MTAWYAPTADGHFNRVHRGAILSTIDDAKGEHAPAFEKLMKSAIRAKSLIANTGWLPAPLRIAHASEPDIDSDLIADAAQ